MRNATYLLLFFLVFSSLSGYADRIVKVKDIAFRQIEIPAYQFQNFTPQVALKMDYASHEVDPEAIDRLHLMLHRNVPYEIDLVFTMYPEDTAAWRTNYSHLLNDRLETLFELAPKLRDRKQLRWNMFLQTQCQTEEEAKQFFHGFVIKYRPKRVRVIDEVKRPEDLQALILGKARTRDSSVIKVIERNQHWKDMLVVMDWTGSMYKYGVQFVLWHKQHLTTRDSRVSHFVFFNDGNRRKTYQKKVGRTGGVYHSKTTDLEEVVKTMSFVMKKGNGGDAPENDIEALFIGTKHLENFKEVILIADNTSEVRDMALLEKIPVPVRVILCGIVNEIHDDYKTIALKTGGSIHTIDKDITQSELLQIPDKGLNQ